MLQSVEWCAKHNLNSSKVWLNNRFLSSFLCETCQVWPWPYEPPWTGVFGRPGPGPNEIHPNYLQTRLCKCDLILSILGPHAQLELENIFFIYLLKREAVLCKCILLSITLPCLVFCWGFPVGQYKYTFWRHCNYFTQDMKQTRWEWFLVTGNPPKPLQKLPLTNRLFSVMGSFLLFVSFRSSVSRHLGWWARSLGRAHAGTPWFGHIVKFKDFLFPQSKHTYKHAKKMKPRLHTSFNVVGGII